MSTHSKPSTCPARGRTEILGATGYGAPPVAGRGRRLPGVLLCVTLLICGLPLAARAAGDRPTGISAEFLSRMQTRAFGPTEQVLADAVAHNDVRNLALNRDRVVSHRPLVNHRIESGSITHQKGSGRCWIFAGFNVLRPAVIERYDLEEFEFSESYVQFWDKLEKANSFLEEMIARAEDPLDDRRLEIVLDTPLGDGGWWSYFVDLVEKYGLIPKEVMPESHASSSTAMMNHLLEQKVGEMGLELRALARGDATLEEIQSRKETHLAEIYRLLTMHLGRPPQQFTWRYETKTDTTRITTYPHPLTPHGFFTKVVGVDLQSYRALFHYPGKAFDQTYRLELSRSVHDRPDFTLLNVPIDTLRACVLASILDSSAVWFACDVGQENYGDEGILRLDIYNYEALFDTSFRLPKEDLIHLGLITPNHAMTFVGVDTLGSQPVKWLVENSWGADAGDDGHWHMYDDWFERYLFGAIVHERYLSTRLRELATRPPILLPPWDPMRAITRLDLGRPMTAIQRGDDE
ncbi:MAG: hypothetical protein GF330_06655 [Candidatus Eisenbacteria bacterium]|nr:hypothetical protein [Candidatus Eisenbacteria bacterium]